MVRQEQELVLADEIWVSNPFTLKVLSRRGLSCRRWEPPIPPPRFARPGRDILLAGLATVRNGIYQVLELLSRHPEWRLRVRAGEGLEPADLLSHPQVLLARGFEEVGLVLAPSWVESHSLEVRQGAALGLPVIATDRAAGFETAVKIPRGDLRAMEAALEESLKPPCG